MESKHITIDLGASSGRVYINYFAQEFNQVEVHRFETKMIESQNYLMWDFNSIIKEVKKGIKIAFQKEPNIQSIGIDTWGCDYGLISKSGKLLRNPIAYRDERTLIGSKLRSNIISNEALYKKTGIQHLSFNTINQIVHDLNYYEEMNEVDQILMIPDLVAYFLTGNKRIELTNLSTTSLYNPLTKSYIEEVYSLGIDKLLSEIIKPGESYGDIKEDIQKELKIPKVPVLAVCSHDTASAIFALDLEENEAYLSSGTWSLLGVLNDDPVINDESFKYNFTNEIGYEEKTRFLKNITGFWAKNLLLQQFNVTLTQENLSNCDKLVQENLSFDSIVDLDDESFIHNKNMMQNFQNYFRKTNQKEAISLEDYLTSFAYSLACKYRYNLDILEIITKKHIESLTIIGGGTQSELMNQLTSDILQIPVKVKFKEASSIGNAIVQYMAMNKKTEKEVKQAYFKRTEKIYYPKRDLSHIYQKYIELIRNENHE